MMSTRRTVLLAVTLLVALGLSAALGAAEAPATPPAPTSETGPEAVTPASESDLATDATGCLFEPPLAFVGDIGSIDKDPLDCNCNYNIDCRGKCGEEGTGVCFIGPVCNNFPDYRGKCTCSTGTVGGDG